MCNAVSHFLVYDSHTSNRTCCLINCAALNAIVYQVGWLFSAWDLPLIYSSPTMFLICFGLSQFNFHYTDNSTKEAQFAIREVERTFRNKNSQTVRQQETRRRVNLGGGRALLFQGQWDWKFLTLLMPFSPGKRSIVYIYTAQRRRIGHTQVYTDRRLSPWMRPVVPSPLLSTSKKPFLKQLRHWYAFKDNKSKYMYSIL